MTMLQCLQMLLRSRGLVVPDGRPLYAYRFTEAELRQLEAAWSPELAASRGEQAAALCVLGATHFCQTYRQGPWSWGGILQRVGWGHGLAGLYRAIERGLQYWQRPLLTTRAAREFLLTLVCEGGLPLGVLTDPERQRHLTRYLRLLLEAVEHHGGFGASEMARRYQEVLPASLQQDVVRTLCVQLVLEVSQLRARVRGTHDPVGQLDALEPGWRQRLSVAVSDEVAQRLVEGLVRHVVPAIAPTLVVEVTPQLVLSPQGASLRRQARWASEVPRGALLAFLGLADQPTVGRLYLSFVLEDGRKLRAATATPKGDTYRIQVDSSTPLPGQGPGAVRLLASAAGKELAVVVPPGGEALEELPWVFRNGDSTHHDLVGVGATQTRGTSVYVALPPGWHLDPADPGEQGPLPEVCGRLVRRIMADTDLVGPSQRCRVRLAASEDSPRYLLRGSFFGQDPASGVLLGAPGVCKLGGGGSQQEVPASSLWWKPLHGTWQPLSAMRTAPLGEGLLAVHEGGQETFRARGRILPRDFSLRATPRLNQPSGTLEASGRDVVSLGLVGPAAVTAEKDGDCKLLLTASSTASIPATVQLEVLLRSGGGVRLQAPFPETSARFVRGDGTVHGAQVPVAIHRLASVAARATGAMASGALVIQGQLTRNGGGWQELGSVRRVQEGLAQLALDELGDKLRLLLASTSWLDAEIELRLVHAIGSVTPLAAVKVLRYEGSLSPVKVPASSATAAPDQTPPSGDLVVVAVELEAAARQALGPAAVQQLRVEARRLDQPEEPPLELTPVGSGRWELPANMEPGPWMLVARQGGAIRLRPLCVNARLAEAAPLSSRLRAAIRTEQRLDRHEMLGQVMNELARGFEHPDWPLLQQFVASTREMPAASYEAVVALSEHPETAAMAMLSASEELLPVLFRSLEELPFAWFLVPQPAWAHATERVLAWIEHLAPHGTPEQRRAIFEATTQAFFRHIEALSPPVGVLAEKLRATLGLLEGPPSWIGPERTPAHLGRLHAALEDVVRANLDEAWPAWDIDAEALLYGVSLRPVEQQLSRIGQLPARYRAVLLAPFLAAELVISGETLRPETVSRLRWLRAFDAGWFDTAMAAYQAIHQSSDS